MKKLITFLLVSCLVTTKLLAGAASYPVASGATTTTIQGYMSAAVTAGNTDITLQFAKGGTWGTSASSGDITIAVPAGVTKLTLTYDPATSGATPILYLNTLTYADALMTGGITFDGVKLFTGTPALRYLVNSASNTNFPAKVTIQNCWVEGYRGVFVLGTYTNTVSQITFTNSTFKSIGTSGIISTGAAASTLNNISMTNNTFIDCNAVASSYFFDMRQTTIANTVVTFNNNTVYYSAGQLGNGFFRLYSGTSIASGSSFSNNIFASGTMVTPATFKFGYATGYTNVTGSGNYFSSNMTVNSSVTTPVAPESVTFTKYTESSPSILFVNPASYNFTINDLNFAGKITAGNSNCFYPETVTITGGSIVNLDYNLGSGPSTAKTFTISTILLRGAVTLTAPTDYEISTDNSAFTGTLTLGGLGSDLTNQTVYVRLKAGKAVNTYNESVSVTTALATYTPVTCSGSVTNVLPVLNSPTGLSSTSVTYTGFHASWSAVSNVTTYTLRILLNGATSSTVTGLSGTSYDVTGLTPGSNYTFAVTAIGDAVNYNSSVESSQSATITLPYIYLFISLNNASAGSVTKSPNTATYSPNATVQLTATKNFGYAFVNWVDSVSGSVLSAANPYTVTMDGTKHIKAVFNTLTTYNYTVSVTGSVWGTVTLSPTPTGGKYETGTIVSMTAVNDSVSTFLNWEDNTTGKVRTITVDGDKSFVATFSEKSFIVGWDLVTADPKYSRPGDYYSVASNKGVFSAYEPAGTTVSWLTYTASNIPCALLWTTSPTTIHRYFQASFKTSGYKNINVHSNMFAYNQFFYPGQKLQYSTDGTNFTDLATCTLTASTWKFFPATLPQALEDQPMVYLRWTADLTSTPVGSGNDGTGISNIYVFADVIAVYDAVKPTLVSTVPATGSTGASANGTISLTFNKNVKAGTGNCTLGSTVLTPNFSSKTVIFSYTKLAYNTQYSFHIPAGALTNVDGVAFGDTTITFTTMNRPQPTAKLFDAVVAIDGTGNYTTIQAAVNAVPDNSTAPYLIFVKNGTYNGHVDIPSTKPYINLIGQSRDSVIISAARLSGASAVYPDSVVYSVDPGATVVVKSANCYFENICFENKFGYANLSGPQALALYTLNDRVILNNCWLRSYQDTYLTTYGNVAYRHYVKNCRIEGAVDFIYGGGDVFFDACTIYCTRSTGGYIVAPSHLAGTQWGYVFSNCTIDGPNASYTTYLGRPWANSPKASFFNTTTKINIYPSGWWHSMGAIPAIFADYNTMDTNGNLTDLSQRISSYDYVSNGSTITGTAKSSFTDAEAAQYTYANVTSGSDAWDPRAVTEPTIAPVNVAITSGGALSWDATPYSICYVVLRNNKVIGFTTSPGYTDASYIPSATYNVVAVSQSGALSSQTTAVASIATKNDILTLNSAYAYTRGTQLIVENVISGSKVSVYSFGGLILDQKTALSNTLTFDYSVPCIIKIKSDKTSQLLKVIR
ncbi:MAG: pectinesterase family protein [Paludibacter sp.]